jgi:CDP-paratose 2-epimerase
LAVALITGSAGLVGAETARFLAGKGFDVVGIDNDMRRYFFGVEASTAWSSQLLKSTLEHYTHLEIDIRDFAALEVVFRQFGRDIVAIIRTAAQPSHDWAAREPLTDFSVNAQGTLNLLELTRRYAPEAGFVFTSTNKVYGDTPNALPLIELSDRWEVDAGHKFSEHGIDESMSIDGSMHSLFGASKLAADILVQEYGRYFHLRTACFRGGCLTGPGHSGTQLHGFLAYLVKCAITGAPYVVFGYKGKQVRDNLHASDLVNAFWQFLQNPREGEVYNIGGSRDSNCSMLEAIAATERVTRKSLQWSYSEASRAGDHIWWISDVRKFRSHYPEWRLAYDCDAIVADIADKLLAGQRTQVSLA